MFLIKRVRFTGGSVALWEVIEENKQSSFLVETYIGGKRNSTSVALDLKSAEKMMKQTVAWLKEKISKALGGK